MLYKGGIFQAWEKKQTVALQKAFFDTLPKLPTVKERKADIAWFLYDLVMDGTTKSAWLGRSPCDLSQGDPFGAGQHSTFNI